MLDTHIPAAELDHLRAHRPMDGIQRSLAKQRRSSLNSKQEQTSVRQCRSCRSVQLFKLTSTRETQQTEGSWQVADSSKPNSCSLFLPPARCDLPPALVTSVMFPGLCTRIRLPACPPSPSAESFALSVSRLNPAATAKNSACCANRNLTSGCARTVSSIAKLAAPPAITKLCR